MGLFLCNLVYPVILRKTRFPFYVTIMLKTTENRVKLCKIVSFYHRTECSDNEKSHFPLDLSNLIILFILHDFHFVSKNSNQPEIPQYKNIIFSNNDTTVQKKKRKTPFYPQLNKKKKKKKKKK